MAPVSSDSLSGPRGTAPVPPPRSPFRLLVAGLALFNLLVLVLLAWNTVRERALAVVRAERTTRNLALVLEQSLTSTFHGVDMALLSILDTLEDPSAHSGTAAAHVATQASRLPFVETLGITDTGGHVIHAAGLLPAFEHDASNQTFFERLKAARFPGYLITPPSREGWGGAWVVTLARRWERPDGSFGGAVFATLPLAGLTHLMDRVDVGPHGSISLRGPDLALLAREPSFSGLDQMIGDTRVTGDYRVAVDSGARESSFTTSSKIDGTARTYAYRRMTSPDLYILVSLGAQDYLATWREETSLYVGGALSLLLLSVGLAWMAHAAWGRQTAFHQERERLIGQLTQALGEVKTLGGMLPICGHCKKIRDDQGYWNKLESYLSEHTDATWTHGICPDCAQTFLEEARTRPPKERP